MYVFYQAYFFIPIITIIFIVIRTFFILHIITSSRSPALKGVGISNSRKLYRIHTGITRNRSVWQITIHQLIIISIVKIDIIATEAAIQHSPVTGICYYSGNFRFPTSEIIPILI